MGDLSGVRTWLCDMDGVLIRDGAAIAGADQFIRRLLRARRDFLVLTNNSLFTPRQLGHDLRALGLDIADDRLWTSALATARFVQTHRPFGTAFVIGCESMHEALAEEGYRENATDPDYVVVAETWEYSYEDFARAIRFIDAGSHFVCTNPEATGPSLDGTLPGTGAMCALITAATGVSPYVVGKPNSTMIREAMDVLHASSDSTVMVGDRMETDILVGVDAGLRTVLVLSGDSTAHDAGRYWYRPSVVVDSVAQLHDLI